MILIGIHDGHNSGCAIFKNNKLICALSEEWITRNKNEYGFPANAINYCLKFSKVKKIKLLYQLKNYHQYFLVKRNTTFKLEDYFREQHTYYYKKILELKNINSLYAPPGPGDESSHIGAAYSYFVNNNFDKRKF
jgi:predicted NodU family carbamoyl transferase